MASAAHPRHSSGRYVVRDDAGHKIKTAREAAGLSQSGLGVLMLAPSETAGQQIVKRIEHGTSIMEHVMNAAAALGMKLEEVIEYRSGT